MLWFKKKVRTRFAPSPTGLLHVGGLRTALYCYLFARKQRGTFVLRIEDTDKTREVPGATEKIIETLNGFGLTPDEGPRVENGTLVDHGKCGPYIQSKRLSLYTKYAEELILKRKAYYCFCTPERLDTMRQEQQATKQAPKYDKHCLKLRAEVVNTKLAQGIPHVIRQNVQPGREVSFIDAVHGEVKFDTSTIDDQVLLKSDGFPTYHLANVVDDHLMEITHVIRGDEWMPSTPKHLLIFEAFGWKPPIYAHIPLLLSPDRKKLSKRMGDVAVEEFIKQGYLPEALLNFVALLGWNPGAGDEQEIFSLPELIKKFELTQVHKAGAVFDLQKLDWINGFYIRQMDVPRLASRCLPFMRASYPNADESFVSKIIVVERERLKKLSDIAVQSDIYFQTPSYAPTLLVWKKSTAENAHKYLNEIRTFAQSLDNSLFTGHKKLESAIIGWIKEKNYKNGDVLWPLRVALTGREQSPSPFEVMFVIGKKETLARIENALEKLK